MARAYTKDDAQGAATMRRQNIYTAFRAVCFAVIVSAVFFAGRLGPGGFALIGGLIPMAAFGVYASSISHYRWVESERRKESERRAGKPVLGLPPERNALNKALTQARASDKIMIDRYLVGFEVESGAPIWVTDDELCSHGCVFAKTGVGKTLWLEGLMFQQMARGRASGFTFIDAKRDPGTLADIIMMALITGRIEDVIVVDPFDPVCAYNFVFTTQRADVKARKVLRCGLPPTSDQSTTKHYDRLAADAVYRVVRAMESLGLAWSVRDIAVALSAFNFAYPRMRALLSEHGSKQAIVELGHLASSYRTAKGSLDSARLTDNLRGIASELHSLSNSEAGEMFCAPRADLSLTDAILRGKLIYYMLPRLEEAESAARMVKVFREDLEVSIGEVTSNRMYRLEDPHMVIIDEGASTFGPTWANLFELARKGRFALLFGAQSIGGLMDEAMGLSEQFYERVIANVNLKVIMRLGDNKTAEDMCEWIGKVTTTKKSISSALSVGFNARELTKNVEINRRSTDSVRDGITLADDEEDLVSAEELKHEMSAEKGLAWFDKGDGRLRKGRAIWFDAELPGTWEGREYLTRYESVEADEIGLAEWVDEHILSIEQAENERDSSRNAAQNDSPPPPSGSSAAQAGSSSTGGESSAGGEADYGGPFRFNLLRGFRGRTAAKTFVAPTPPPAAASAAPTTGASGAPAAEQKPPQEVTSEQKPPVPAAQPPDKKEVSERQRAANGHNVNKDSAEKANASGCAPVSHKGSPAKPEAKKEAQAPANNAAPAEKAKPKQNGKPSEAAAKKVSAPAKASSEEVTKPAQGGASPQGNAAPGAKPGAPGKNKLVLQGKGKDTVARVGKR